MTAPDHDGGLAALYALGGLDAAERSEFEQHLEVCRTCVEEVRRFLPVAHGLAHAAPPLEPPESLRRRVLGLPGPEDAADGDAADTSDLSETPPPVTPRAGSGERLGLGFKLLAGLCVLVAAALGWYASRQVNLARDLEGELEVADSLRTSAAEESAQLRLVVQDLRSQADVLAAPDVTTLVLEGQPGAETATGRAFISPTRGVVVTASDLPPLAPGRVYQMWFVTRPDPVSGGLAQGGEDGRVFAPTVLPIELAELIALAVTDEPTGGVERPSGDVLLLGRHEQD